MENNYSGAIGPSDAATLSLLSGGYGGIGVGGRGGLGYGNEVLAADAHANGTATKTAIDCHSSQFLAGLDRVSDQAEEGRRTDQINRVNDNITNSENRSSDRQRDIERLMIDGQKEAAKCCCDAKLEACKNTSELKSLIISENSKTRDLMQSTALDAANAKIVQLETINALRPTYHHCPTQG